MWIEGDCKFYHFHGTGLSWFGLSNPLKTDRKNRKEGGGTVIILYYFHYMLQFWPIFTVFSLFFADFLRFSTPHPPSFPKKLPLLRGFHAANRAVAIPAVVIRTAVGNYRMRTRTLCLHSPSQPPSTRPPVCSRHPQPPSARHRKKTRRADAGPRRIAKRPGAQTPGLFL